MNIEDDKKPKARERRVYYELIECPECEGTGVNQDYDGCGDFNCCDDINCWSCGGDGYLDEEE